MRFDPIVHYRQLAGLDVKGALGLFIATQKRCVKSHRDIFYNFLYSKDVVFFKNGFFLDRFSIFKRVLWQPWWSNTKIVGFPCLFIDVKYLFKMGENHTFMFSHLYLHIHISGRKITDRHKPSLRSTAVILQGLGENADSGNDGWHRSIIPQSWLYFNVLNHGSYDTFVDLFTPSQIPFQARYSAFSSTPCSRRVDTS